MSERGEPPGTSDDAGLSLRLERLLQEYSSKLDSLELRLPEVGAPPEPPAPFYFKNYFPDEPAAAKPKPLSPPAPPSWARAPEPVELAPPEPEEPAPVAFVPEKLEPAATPAPPPAPGALRPKPVARPFASPVRPAAKPLGWKTALALSALLVGLGLWKGTDWFSSAPHRFYPLPQRALAALTAGGGKLYAYGAGRLVEIDAEGRSRDAGPLSGDGLVGLARDDGGAFWTSASGQDALFEHGFDAQRSIRRAYPYPNRRFSAVALSGDTLWALDAETGAAYQYMLSRSLLGTSLTPISQFDGSPQTALAAGLSVSGGLLWLCDPAQRRMLRYRAAGSRLAPVDQLDLVPWVGPGSRVTGIAVTPEALWVLTGWPAGLHRFRLDGLAWKPFSGD